MEVSVEAARIGREAGATIPPEPRSGSLRRHANLTRELAITQFKLKYTGSVLGYVWSLVKPLMIFAILWVIFDKVFHLGRGTDRFVLQLLVAVVLFTFFQETTSTAMNAIAGNGNLIRKAYFPRPILVIAASLSSLITFLINMSLIVVIATPMGQILPGWRTLLLPLFVIELYALVLGLSLLLSALFVFHRDLGHIWEIFMQLLVYGSAVMFPLSLIHKSWEQTLILANPVAQIIEDVRRSLVTPHVAWSVDVMHWAYAVPLGLTLLALGLGYLVFTRMAPRFAEYL